MDKTYLVEFLVFETFNKYIDLLIYITNYNIEEINSTDINK